MTAPHPLANTIGAGVAVIAIVASLPAHAAPPVTAPSAASARCQVWARELSFAAAVAAHNVAAFAEHVHAEAAFGVGRTPTLGRDAIAREWAGIVDGSQVQLEWYPEVVIVAGDGRIAYSSGPALYRDPRTGAARTGRFGSVWQLGSDALWRVVFDDGITPVPADAAAVEAFHAGRRTACPAS